MKKLITLSFALFLAFSAFSQRENTLISGVRLTGLWGGSINGLVNLDNDFSLNNGGFFAFEINNDFLVGWSGYGNGTKFSDGRDVEINGHDLLLGYTHRSDNVIHPVLNLKFGSGNLEVSGENDDRVNVFEPSAGLELNVTRWFRLGLEGGYRFIGDVNTSGFSGSDLSSPVVGLRLKFGWSWRD